MRKLLAIAGNAVLYLVILTGARADPRSWTEASGQRSYEAEFVRLEEGRVTLRKTKEGGEVTLDLADLSEPDQTFAKESELGRLCKAAFDIQSNRETAGRSPNDAMIRKLEAIGERVEVLMKELTGGDRREECALMLRIIARQPPEVRAVMEPAHVRTLHAESMYNLKVIGIALADYAADNNGDYPDQLESLLEHRYLSNPNHLVDFWGLPFLYLGKKLKNVSPSGTPVAVQNPKERKKVAVLYVDSSTRLLTVNPDVTVFEEPYAHLNKIVTAARNQKPIALQPEPTEAEIEETARRQRKFDEARALREELDGTRNEIEAIKRGIAELEASVEKDRARNEKLRRDLESLREESGSR